MATTEELLLKIYDLLRITPLLESNALCHILYRTFPTNVEFIAGVITISLSSGEEVELQYVPPVGKVKVPSYQKWAFEAQRVTTLKWTRDGKVLLDASGMIDIELIPPYSYEAWYPIHRLASFRLTNDDTVTRKVSLMYTAYLLDESLYNKVMKLILQVPDLLGIKE